MTRRRRAAAENARHLDVELFVTQDHDRVHWYVGHGVSIARVELFVRLLAAAGARKEWHLTFESSYAVLDERIASTSISARDTRRVNQ